MEEDDHDIDAVPSFWTPTHQTGWDRIKAAVKLARGKPREGGLDWDLARQAIRLGYGAAGFWLDDAEWCEALEARVRAEWFGVGNGVAWDQAAPLVRYGWEIGRKDFVE